MSQTQPPISQEGSENLREEWINGRLYTSPRPAGPHIIAQGILYSLVSTTFLRGKDSPGGWWILPEPETLFVRNRLVPDIAGWKKERMPKIPKGHLFEVIPDWVCEIVSEGSRKMDRTIKPSIYLRSGVKHMWIIEPEAKTLEVFRATKDGWLTVSSFSDDAEVEAEPFDSFMFSLAELWEGVESSV